MLSDVQNTLLLHDRKTPLWHEACELESSWKPHDNRMIACWVIYVSKYCMITMMYISEQKKKNQDFLDFRFQTHSEDSLMFIADNIVWYSLPVKGMFARTDPQLVFLLELLQAHGANLQTQNKKREVSERNMLLRHDLPKRQKWTLQKIQARVGVRRHWHASLKMNDKTADVCFAYTINCLGRTLNSRSVIHQIHPVLSFIFIWNLIHIFLFFCPKLKDKKNMEVTIICP